QEPKGAKRGRSEPHGLLEIEEVIGTREEREERTPKDPRRKQRASGDGDQIGSAGPHTLGRSALGLPCGHSIRTCITSVLTDRRRAPLPAADPRGPPAR